MSNTRNIFLVIVAVLFITMPPLLADVAVNGTSTSSGDDGTYIPSYAFDDDPATFTYFTLPYWIKYDLGAGVAKTVNSYTLTARSGTYHYFKDFTLQGSNNDSAWTTIDTITGQVFSAGEKKSYILSTVNTTAYRYYRFSVTDSQSGSYAEIAEIELFELRRIFIS